MLTWRTLVYIVLWVIMMVLGGLMYEQPHFVRKRNEKYKTLEVCGWCMIIIAMLGCVHGILYTIHWIMI